MDQRRFHGFCTKDLPASILEAAVHIQHLAGGPGGVVAAQIGDGGGHVAQFAHPLEADTGGQGFDTVMPANIFPFRGPGATLFTVICQGPSS